jgi:hypothetical protein
VEKEEWEHVYNHKLLRLSPLKKTFKVFQTSKGRIIYDRDQKFKGMIFVKGVFVCMDGSQGV